MKENEKDVKAYVQLPKDYDSEEFDIQEFPGKGRESFSITLSKKDFSPLPAYFDLIQDYNQAFSILETAYNLLYKGKTSYTKKDFKPVIENFLKQNK